MKTIILLILAVCLTLAFSFFITEEAFAQGDQEHKVDAAGTDGNSPYVTGITAGRAKSLVGVAAGLVGLIVGWRARARSAVSPSGRNWTIAAFALGSAAIVLGVTHLATTTGGFGTGGGKAGAIVALVLGLIGLVRSGPVLLRPK